MTYRELAEPSEGLFKEKGSKFIAYAYPVWKEEEVKDRIQMQKKAHPKARHHCFAYRIGFDGLLFRANDDGEPSGTGGKPILNQIDTFALSNTLVIVVRYFGGKLLGASGLAQAYKESTRDALLNGRIITKERRRFYRIDFEYRHMASVLHTLKNLDIPIEEKHLSEKAYLIFSLPFKVTGILNQLQCQILDCYEDDLKDEMKYDGLSLRRIS